MDSPIAAISSETIGAFASAPNPSAEGASVQASKTQQSSPNSSAPTPSQQKDSVQLSSEALSLSKELSSPKDSQAVTSDTIQPQNTTEPVIQKPADKIDISTTKSFPPFMGDGAELKQLKLFSPALYRQVLKMIVPPPVNISYTDLQIIKAPVNKKINA